MDRKRFYAALRQRTSGVFGTSLSQSQVNGLEALLAEGEGLRLPQRQLAYVLATAYHETAHTMQPIEEYGKGKGRKYGKPDGPYGKVYFGRGFVQLTWLTNYRHAGEELGVNLVKFPEKALELDIASEILFRGMIDGWFTGKRLDDYISGDHVDYESARRIVNGTDRAKDIAKYARSFEKALSDAEYYGALKPAKPVAAPETIMVTPAPPKPQPQPEATPVVKRSLLQIILDIIFRRKGA